MQLAEISIRRPVFATVLSLLVLLIGAVSFTRLSVREYPKIDEPVVTVSVRYAANNNLSVIGGIKEDKDRISEILQETWESADDWFITD